ncbi:MAG TPA: hypothetical protein VN721_15705 [Flavipsychrobacter sp.]|nr:hypothetical protein [Flavipsychrobacter sp.]
MKIVKVVYTAKPDFTEQNKKNIQTVMNDLQQLNNPGIFYSACLSPDNKTFIHTAFFRSEEDHKMFSDLPSFLDFQKQLNAAGFEASPKQELLTLVGSSKAIF